jgi:phosphoribosylformimino-5-aminoimidazole carboxamide ribotide isomerase
VIVGTAALERPETAADAIREFGADNVAFAIDARAGTVAIRGWAQASGMDAAEFGRNLHALGARLAIVTDIARDGMMGGIDARAMADLVRATGLRVIASGGTASLDDIHDLVRVAPIGIEGVVIGQALYRGAFSFAQAKEIVATHHATTND